MAGSQISTSVTIINSLLGFQALSLTNYDTSALSAIAAGSKIEIASAFFTFTSDETINASSWTAIATATSAYLYLTPSGTAGSQILSASWESTAPVWSTSKQGWYSSAGSNIRVAASAYKVSNTQQVNKLVLYKEWKHFIISNDLPIRSHTTFGNLAASGATIIIPAGTWYVTLETTSNSPAITYLQIYDGSLWRTILNAGQADVGVDGNNYPVQFVISDGVNVRAYMPTYVGGWGANVSGVKVY